MKKRIFLIIATLLLVFTLASCNLENREVELAANVSFNPEMVEKTTQQVTVNVDAYEQDLSNLEVTYQGKTPEVATISEEGLIKALVPGKADFEVVLVLGEAKKVIEFSVNVQALQYTITYNLDGGVNSELNPEGFVEADLPLELQPATKAGYAFLGWEYEGEIIKALPAGTIRNVELTAKWEIVEYAISYDLAGGAHEGDAPVKYTVADEVVLGAATKAGYTFAGWYLGEEKVEKVEAGSTGDLALVAKWEVVEYAIAYELNGGELADAPAKYTVEDEVVLAAPTKAEHRFLGWYLNGQKVEKIAKGTTGDLTLEAKWELDKYTISYDLAGGQVEGGYVYDEAKATQEFKLTKYINYDVNGLAASLRDKANLTWWGHIALKATADPEVFEIIQIANKSSGITEEFDYVIAWHSACTDTASKAVMDAILAKAAEYVGDYVVIKGIPTDAGDAEMTVKVFEASDVVYDDGLQNEYTQKEEVVLPVPTKAGYEFLGWYEGETKVEKIEMGSYGNKSFVAKWEAVEYTINFDLQGGELAEKVYTFEEIQKELLADFNRIGGTSLDAAGFAAGSSSAIKVVMANAEFLAKWNWFFAFAIADLKAANPDATSAYLLDVYPALEESLKGEYAIFTGSNGANARTMIRNYMGGLLQAQKGCSSNTVFQAFATDFSEQARKDALVKAANAGSENVYTIEDEVELPVPTKADHTFLGWYLGETKVEKIEKGTTGDLTLVAKWEANQPEEPKHEHVACPVCGLCTAEDCDGEAAEKCQGHTEEPKHEHVACPVCGLCTAEDCDGTDAEKCQGHVVEPEQPGKVVYVGAGKDYETLDAAVQGVEDGTTIVLEAGEYSLSVVIAKSVVIKGPNADEKAPANTHPEALINVEKDVAGNLAAKNIEFNGVHLKGTGGGAGIPGISFQDGGNIEKLSFKSCVISDTNTFLKFVGGASNAELLMQDCHIRMIGQFVLWTTTGINKTLLIGNQIDGGTCGAVTNAAAALFRVRNGSLEAYNNYFNGDSANIPGYFECSAGASVVKYNTFFNVTAFVHPTANNNIVFDQNLYLVEGIAQDKAPASLMGGGTVKADATVAKNSEELEMLFLNYLLTSNPNRYFEVEFDANGGTITSLCPSVYDKEAGIAALPTIVRDGFVFDGWYVNGQKVDSIPVGTTGKLKVVAQWVEDCLVVDGTTGAGHFATIADALAAAKAGDIIRLAAGEYAEDVTISVANLTIKGPNAGVDANTGARAAEAVIKGVITLTSDAYNFTVDGLAFTGNAKIKYDESKTYEGFTFKNNKVYDTTESAVAWDESRYTLPGFIQFTLASGGSVKNTYILNNSFVNVSEVNLLLNRAINVSVDGNVFKDFDLDAIRIEGGYAYGALGFTNNTFEQTVEGNGNVGIFFYSIAGSSDAEKALVLIENNSFIKVGKDNGTVFTSAIAGYRFQENYTTYSIKNNVFDHCYDYIYIRNNGGNSTNWFCTVENNQFLGLPHNQYYGSYRGADSESSNPHLAVFTQNYYEDNDGKVISDLSAYAAYFKHMGSYGTALAAKPAKVVAERVEFWTIAYDLQEGTTKDAFVNEYTSLQEEAIVLPTLTKPNHQFNGWLLNGQLVTSIPASTKGDLALVADFTQLEGEIYTITFHNEKDTAVWPSRGAESREEIIAELFSDLYEWAQGNGETRDYATWEADINGQLKAYSDIKLRNTELGNYPAEDGSTEYFFNVPKYYQKWNEFFAVFNTAMLAVNSGQVFYTDTYAAMVRLYQFISWSSTGQNYFSSYIPKMCAATKVPAEIPTSYRGGQVVELPVLSMENGLAFLGWYDNAEFNGEAITSIKSTDMGNKDFYAKWDKEVLAEKLDINSIKELLLFTTHQLVWSITPENTTNKEVEFFSSNESVATVSAKGLITALATGTTTITVRVYGNRALDLQFEVAVYVNDYIKGSYETESYAIAGEKVQLNATVEYKNGTTGAVKWSSLTPEIATVDENGVVTTIKAGIAKIVATDPNNESLKLEYVVTVLDKEAAGVLDLILRSHESNIFTKYNLGIGAGIPVYYKDIFGSANKILFNDKLVIDATRKDMEVEANTGDYFESMKSIEFITVHYTGNMSSGADAKANANYFVGDNAVSIHYTTGNDGVYQALDHAQGAWHAGDSGAYDQVGEFKWHATGVKVGANDPQYPTFTVSQDFYYEINGQKTSVPMARPWNYSGRGTDHVLNADGTISSQANFGQTGFQNREPESFINDMGLPFKIVDGEYYMGSTWWCYTQVYEGRICSTGGNRNSLGIESCVDKGSDLWYTWQKTAQLVAKLMYDTNLDITRVRGHHFFSGKDCPQPMLANNCEIWYEFRSLIEAEYELLTEYSDYEIKFESHNPEILDNNGRIIKQPSETTCVTYTVTITKDGQSQSVTLASMIQGMYVDR